MQYMIPLYLILINAAAFAIMCLDKHYAKIGHWRVPESTLLTIAAVGGSLGALLGMLAARHKTRKLKFQILVPLFLLLHLVLLFLSCSYL